MNGAQADGRDDDFSPVEREALAAWRTPAPPPGFSRGVMRAFEADASARGSVAPQALRSLAVAAAALLLLGGLLSLRGWSAGGTFEESAAPLPVPGFTANDGGPGPEVRPEVGLEIGGRRS